MLIYAIRLAHTLQLERRKKTAEREINYKFGNEYNCKLNCKLQIAFCKFFIKVSRQEEILYKFINILNFIKDV